MIRRPLLSLRWAAGLRWLAFAGLLAGWASAGLAAEVELGLGRDGVLNRSGSGALALGLDVKSSPLASFGRFEFGVGGAAEIDDSGDAWAGLGPFAYLPLARGYRLDASVMAGAYAHGSGHDLGLPLEFRSRIGLSRRIADRWRLGLAFEHKSNAGAGDDNPGVETLFITVTRIY